MKDTLYLLMDRNGVQGHRKNRPNLKAGQYAVRLTVNVPDSFFRRAIPEVDIEVPEGYMIEPPIQVGVADPPATPEQVRDLLGLVGIPSLGYGVEPDARYYEKSDQALALIGDWNQDQLDDAARWAGAAHLSASDNDVDVPPKPAWVTRLEERLNHVEAAE